MMSLISTYFNLSDPLKAGDFNLILELLGLLLPFLIMILLCFLVCVLLFIAKRKYFKDVTYTFTHWGTEKKGSGFEFTSSWSKFLYYKETKRFILLYISKTDSLILQKKMFKDDAELEDFKLFISERLPRA